MNIAAGKRATQSSTIAGSAAARAVDGDTNGNWAAGSVTHTDNDPEAWWEVDLGAVDPTIGAVDVWTRTDCCGDRLRDFYVLVSDVPFAATGVDAALQQPGVDGFFVAGQAGSPSTVPVGRSGRYVRVQLSGWNYLSLAEVQVWGTGEGTPPPSPTPTPTPDSQLLDLALGQPASQSSTLAGAAAARAVDGNTNGDWAASSVTHTNNDALAWWEVDLGAGGAIDTVNVWNRTDCCGDRLHDFYVLVSGVPFVSTNLDAVLQQAGVSAYFTGGVAGPLTSIQVGRSGRYVRVQLAGGGYLSLAEVEVWGTSDGSPRATPTPTSTSSGAGTATPTWTEPPAPTPTPTVFTGGGAGTNLALGKAATQSSTLVGATAARAVDGITDGNWGGGSVTHTQAEFESWWQVDLGASEPIETIDVWNRTDCCGSRLSNFYVFVSDSPFSSTSVAGTLAQGGVSAFLTGGTAGSPTTIPVNRTGRYVRVQLTATNYLSLAEVEVWRAGGPLPPTATPTATIPGQTPTSTPTPGTGPTNLVLGKLSTQSSTAFGGVASRANDGNTDGNWNNQSVTHTSRDNEAWWEVDLGGSNWIETIEIWNRTDCCGDRLSDFYVHLSATPFTSTDLVTTLAQPGVVSSHVAGQAGSPTTLTVNQYARYVRVQLTGQEYLSIAEVCVLGTAVP